MKKSYAVMIGFLLSILCLIMPIYYDLQSSWYRAEFIGFAVGFFVLFNFLFYYAYQNFQSKFKIRKYLLASLTVLIIMLLAGAGFYRSSDIPTLGAMLVYAMILLPILCVAELLCWLWQQKKT